MTRNYLCLLSLILSSLLLGAQASELKSAAYVGAERCKTCHEDAYQNWQGSHHDLAMQVATDKSVLGDFQDRDFEHFGISSRFYTKAGKYYVETDNAQGEMESFEVLYTFGFYPLQQYLVDIGDGRLQALLLTWDSRPVAEGGQRWFHLYPDDAMPASDPLHWTGAYFNWNSRCAECHSTNLKRNYIDVSHGYETTWSEINVACESCHGPGKAHAEAGKSGLIRSLRTSAEWQFDGEPTAKRVDAGHSQLGGLNAEINACGGCHARRAMTGETITNSASQSFNNDYHLALIDAPLYHADGQIDDEVYVLGSFMQSKMFQAGVTCTNCHKPHSLALRSSLNGVCAQCHNAEVFDAPKHHHHKQNSEAAECVSCHMPEKTYMVVDPRRDHSLRIPRPDLSLKYGTPNACASCHDDEEALAEGFLSWFENKPLPPKPALLGADASKLASLVADKGQNAIIAASALSRLAAAPDATVLRLAQINLNNNAPLIRVEALKILGLLPPDDRLVYLLPLIDDPVKSVRLEVARQIALTSYQGLGRALVAKIEALLSEYRATLVFHRDTAAGQLNMGLFELSLGDLEAAIASYRRALLIEPLHLGAHLNLADVYRMQGESADALALLKKAVAHFPASGDAQHSLGLAWIRARDYKAAIVKLKRASELQPDNQRYLYVYLVALDALGETQDALVILSGQEKLGPLLHQLQGQLRSKLMNP